MSYTYPDGQPQGVAKKITNKLREILIAEIYAIDGYQLHIANSNMPEINKAWQSIMDDEKKHYGYILTLIRKYDPEQEKQHIAHKDDKLGEKTPMQFYNPDYSSQIILNNLRDDIKGELEAVILYDEEMAQFTQQDIRTTLQLIINEEKGHAEHLTELVLKYDRDKYNSLD